MIARQTARHAPGSLGAALALVLALASVVVAQSPSISPQSPIPRGIRP